MSYPERSIDEDWRRLIPSRFPTIEIYERLGPPELQEVAKKLEAETNPRLLAAKRLTGGESGINPKAPQLQNWNHAPFAYKNPEGSTFLNPAYGVMELTHGVEAALAVALQRREVFLERTSEPAMLLDMRMLSHRITGTFLDLTEVDPTEPQERRWELGRQAYEAGAAGVLFRRAQRPQDLHLAVFDMRVLGKAVQGAHYRFFWDSKMIRMIYDFSGKGVDIARSDLLSPTAGRAAA